MIFDFVDAPAIAFEAVKLGRMTMCGLRKGPGLGRAHRRSKPIDPRGVYRAAFTRHCLTQSAVGGEEVHAFERRRLVCDARRGRGVSLSHV